MITVLCTSDFCPQKRVAQAISQGDYSCLELVRPYIESSDYSLVNLEAPVVTSPSAHKIIKTGPCLKCSEQTIDLLKTAGFRCVTLANNHFYDYGDEGVRDTLSVCKKRGIDCVGGGVNLKDASKTLYVDIKGEKIAIVNFCEIEWSIATELSGGAAPKDLVANYYQIKEAKEKADYVIVVIHGGREHYQLPRPDMQKEYRFFVDAGADVIINHHQHCYTGYEIYKGHPIFYGLGNFCFDADGTCKSYWQEGYMVSLCFDKEISFKLIPYLQCDKEPIVIPLSNAATFNKSIASMNAVIADPKRLSESMDKWVVEKERKSYLGFIEPLVTNRYLSFIWRHGWMPSLWSRKKRRVLLNVIRCETHRDVLIRTLNTNK